MDKAEFVVYTTQPIPLEPIIHTLNSGWDHDDMETYDFWGPVPAGTPSFVDAPVSSVIAHHRAQSGTDKSDQFLVVDRVDWEDQGVLAVNMNFEGNIDAARFPPNIAGISLVCLDIANTDWHEMMEEALDPPSFVLYAADPTLSADEESKEALRWKLQAGLASRKQEQVKAVTLPLAPSSPEVVDEDVSVIAEAHESIAEGLGGDAQLFIVADEADWAGKGVLIGKVGEDGVKVETCRRSVDVAAEILQWVRAGLFTWEEGKVWDEVRVWDQEEEWGERGEMGNVEVEEMGSLEVQGEL